jgi:hypothetical protein
VTDRADGQQDQEAAQRDRQQPDVGDLAELPGTAGEMNSRADRRMQRRLAFAAPAGRLPHWRLDAARSARRVP